MANAPKASKNDIRNFLLVVAAGVASAFIVVFWMIKEDPLEKELNLTEALLSPSTIEEMSNRAVRSNEQYVAQYLVESIDFSYFDPNRGKWEMVEVDIEPYKKIYQLLQGDVGSSTVGQEVVEKFNRGQNSTLAIYVRVHKPYKEGSKNTLFQQVQILPTGPWYRVQLHSETDRPEWIYYQHPKVQQKILDILKANG